MSVEQTTIVWSVIPSASSLSSRAPTVLSWSIIVSWYGDCQRPAWPRLSGLVWVRRCMWVVLNHTKNGVPAACWRSMKSSACSSTSSSIVSVRLRVNGPESSIRCLPTRPQRGSSVASSSSLAQQCRTPRGPNRSRKCGKSSGERVVRRLRILLGVQVVEVAEELVEAVHGG
jgi:hypothetical protein